MLRTLLISFFILFSCGVSAQQKEVLLPQLDSVLAHRQQSITEKEKRIDYLKTSLRKEQSSKALFTIYNQIYEEYYVFQFDSAQVYINRGIELAKRQNDKYYYSLFVIRKAQLMAIGGLYHEAKDLIETIHVPNLDKELQFD